MKFDQGCSGSFCQSMTAWPTCRMPAAVCMRARIRLTWRRARNRRVNWLQMDQRKMSIKISDWSSVVSNGRVQAEIMQVCESYPSHLQNQHQFQTAKDTDRLQSHSACNGTSESNQARFCAPKALIWRMRVRSAKILSKAQCISITWILMIVARRWNTRRFASMDRTMALYNSG